MIGTSGPSPAAAGPCAPRSRAVAAAAGTTRVTCIAWLLPTVAVLLLSSCTDGAAQPFAPSVLSSRRRMQTTMKDLGGSGCTKTKPCQACSGDCDTDVDCAAGLRQAPVATPWHCADFAPKRRVDRAWKPTTRCTPRAMGMRTHATRGYRIERLITAGAFSETASSTSQAARAAARETTIPTTSATTPRGAQLGGHGCVRAALRCQPPFTQAKRCHTLAPSMEMVFDDDRTKSHNQAPPPPPTKFLAADTRCRALLSRAREKPTHLAQLAWLRSHALASWLTRSHAPAGLPARDGGPAHVRNGNTRVPLPPSPPATPRHATPRHVK